MKGKSDHLIERAAALLRAGNAAQVPSQHGGEKFTPEPLLTLPGAPLTPSAPQIAPPAPPPRMPTEAGPAEATPPILPLPSKLAVPLRIELPAAAPPQPAGPPAVALDVMERAGLVVARTKRTRISEEYRIVIGRVLRALHEEPAGNGLPNLLLVTSARPGEGKSFTALNLAASIAQNTSESVLLVDIDPKLKPVSALLGLNERQGFLDLVANPALRPEDLVLTTAVPNLSVLPVGALPEDPAKPVDGPNLALSAPAITRLAQRFPKSLVMLDAPPCLSTSDPHTVAPLVGQVVMVVEAERTQRNELEAALDLVRACPNITLLLNKVRLTTSHTFGAYDYFGSYA